MLEISSARLYLTRSQAASTFVLGMVLLGFALRLHQLDYQSLWYDEAFSVDAAGRSLDVIENGIPIGTDVATGELAVTRAATSPQFADLDLSATRAESAAPGVRFLGVLLPNREVPAGHRIELTTFWEVAGAPLGDLLLEIAMVDTEGASVASIVRRPVGEGYPTPRWQPGERLRGRHRLTVPAQAPGRLHLSARLLDAATRQPAGTSLDLGEVTVLDRPHNTTQAPSPRVVQLARLGTEVLLLGYDVDRTTVRPGETVRLRLYWQALGTLAKSYKVFTHLLDEGSQMSAQEDGIPGRGTLPTTSWIAGEYVADEYLLRVKPEAPPGAHLLEIGMYLEPAGERLPVVDDTGSLLDDRIVLLDRVQVVPR